MNTIIFYSGALFSTELYLVFDNERSYYDHIYRNNPSPGPASHRVRKLCYTKGVLEMAEVDVLRCQGVAWLYF